MILIIWFLVILLLSLMLWYCKSTMKCVFCKLRNKMHKKREVIVISDQICIRAICKWDLFLHTKSRFVWNETRCWCRHEIFSFIKLSVFFQQTQLRFYIDINQHNCTKCRSDQWLKKYIESYESLISGITFYNVSQYNNNEKKIYLI